MSGQKQKRPYKRKPILIADEPMPTAEQIEAISEARPITDEDLANLAKSAGGNVIGADIQRDRIEYSEPISLKGAGEFTLVKQGERLTHDDPSPVFVHSLQANTKTEEGRETLDISVVYRVEAAVGRTFNAWGMVDPLELIRAVDRVLRGGEG